MSDFSVRGADEFHKLSKALKDAGRTEMRKTLHKAMKQAVRPLIPQARASARERLPQQGGLATEVAKSPMRVQVRTARNSYGVRIVVGNSRSGAQGANRGVVRHPVFGNREKWVAQKVPEGWFDDAMHAGAPDVRKDVERALERVVDDIIRDAKR